MLIIVLRLVMPALEVEVAVEKEEVEGDCEAILLELIDTTLDKDVDPGPEELGLRLLGDEGKKIELEFEGDGVILIDSELLLVKLEDPVGDDESRLVEEPDIVVTILEDEDIMLLGELDKLNEEGDVVLAERIEDDKLDELDGLDRTLLEIGETRVENTLGDGEAIELLLDENILDDADGILLDDAMGEDDELELLLDNAIIDFAEEVEVNDGLDEGAVLRAILLLVDEELIIELITVEETKDEARLLVLLLEATVGPID